MIDDLKAAISSFLSLCGNQWTMLFLCMMVFAVDRFFATTMLIDGAIASVLVITVTGVAVVIVRAIRGRSV